MTFQASTIGSKAKVASNTAGSFMQLGFSNLRKSGAEEAQVDSVAIQAAQLREQIASELAQQFSPAINTLNQVVDELKKEQEKAFLDLSKPLTELAILIAEQIIDTEISSNAELVSKMVSAMLTELSNVSVKRLEMNPDDVKLIMDSKPEFIETLKDKQIEVVGVASMARGTCSIKSDSIQIEGSIAKRLAALWEEYRKAV